MTTDPVARIAVAVIGTNLVMDYGSPEAAHAAMEALPSTPTDREAALRATIDAMSGDAADLHDLIHEAALLRTALGHVLVRTHDSGCGTCDAARALLTAEHELPSYTAARLGEPR